jgi:toxin-antitoxin system PIN domain toxin
VKLVDANVLLYAVNEDAPRHAVARGWVDAALSSGEAVGFAWIALLAFLRLSTRRGVFPRPLSISEASSVIAQWLAQPATVVLDPTERHLELLRGLLDPLGSAGNLVTDAHLAALALEHGAEVVSFDTDFSRFPGLRWTDPLPRR